MPYKLVVHTGCILDALPRRRGVVGSYSIPCDTHTPEVVSKNPCPYICIDARIEEVLLGHAVLTQCWQPGGIDLHQTEIAGSVRVPTNGYWIEAAFLFRD